MKLPGTWQERRSASAKAKRQEIERCFAGTSETPVSYRGDLFTHIEYWEPLRHGVDWCDNSMRMVFKSYGGVWHKRKFDSYAKAIAHLTKLKLNLIEQDEYPWTEYSACKIVEGYYTHKGTEKILKETELPNERGSKERAVYERRLARQRELANRKAARKQRRLSVPKTMGRRAPPFVSPRSFRSSGSASSSSSIPTMDQLWDAIGDISKELRSTASSLN